MSSNSIISEPTIIQEQKTILKSKDCYIDLDKGYESILLGYSNFEDVEQFLGEGEKIKKKFKAGTLYIFPRAIHELNYANLGIKFRSYSQPKFSRKRIVRKMEFNSTCNCKTKNGLGTGSTFDEISRYLGDGNIHVNSGLKGVSTIISYRLENNFVEFIQSGSVGKGDFFAEKIRITTLKQR